MTIIRELFFSSTTKILSLFWLFSTTRTLSPYMLVSASATAFSYKGGSCGNKYFSIANDVLTCDSTYGECSPGDTLAASGEVSILKSNLPTAAVIKIEVCYFHTSWGSFGCFLTKEVEVDDACEFAGIDQANNQGYYCPEKGTYDFEISEKLPGNSQMSLGSGYTFYVDAYYMSTDKSTTYEKCTLQFEAVNSSKYSVLGVVGALSALLGLAMYGSRRLRRRNMRSPTLNITSHDDSQGGGDFVEMADRGAIV